MKRKFARKFDGGADESTRAFWFWFLLGLVVVAIIAAAIDVQSQPNRISKDVLAVETQAFLLRPVAADQYRQQTRQQKEAARVERAARRDAFTAAKKNDRTLRVVEVVEVKARKVEFKKVRTNGRAK